MKKGNKKTGIIYGILLFFLICFNVNMSIKYRDEKLHGYWWSALKLAYIWAFVDIVAFIIAVAAVFKILSKRPKSDKKLRREKRARYMRSVFSFLCVCFLLFIFTTRIDGEMGIILMFFTFTAPIVSIAFTFAGRNKIRVTVGGETYAAKGQEVTVYINAEILGHFPTAFIEIHTECGKVFTQKHSIYRTALNFKGSIGIKHTLTAIHGGYGDFRIKEVYICDFLGFVKLRAGNAGEPYPVADMGVIPDIPELSSASKLFRFVSDLIITSDEEEQESTLAFTANTSPGYEHREYIEGDSLKRINWKASTKRGTLLVRLDEATSSVQPAIVFDLYRSHEADELHSIIIEERLYEAVFGLVTLFIKNGISVRILHKDSDAVAETNIESLEAVNQILFKILVHPVQRGLTLPFNNLNMGGACVALLAVPKVDAEYAATVGSFGGDENTCIIVSEKTGLHSLNVPYSVWHLDEDNNFKLVR